MTVIRPNSISGVTSITAQGGGINFDENFPPSPSGVMHPTPRNAAVPHTPVLPVVYPREGQPNQPIRATPLPSGYHFPVRTSTPHAPNKNQHRNHGHDVKRYHRRRRDITKSLACYFHWVVHHAFTLSDFGS